MAENGFLAENDLSDILETYLGDLTGDELFEFFNLQFPFVIKEIDAAEPLSLQVHPDDDTAMERYWSYGKDELIYITEAAPEAKLYLGFNRDLNATQLYEACHNGTVSQMMNAVHPQKGEFYHIGAGTVHSIGGGVKCIEISQPGEITLRLYDWGRENNPETQRDLHLEEALDIIDFNPYVNDGAEGCKWFTASRLPITKPVGLSVEQLKSAVAFVCTDGAAAISYKGVRYPFKKGEVVLVPASLEDFALEPEGGSADILQVSVPLTCLEDDSYMN